MNSNALNTLALSGLVFITGCAPAAQPVNSAVLLETIETDRQKIYNAPIEEQQRALKVEDVLARAIKYNLDTKVSDLDALIAADDIDLQMLAALPTLDARIQRQGRSNRGGSSSFSLLTGMESLEPSISQEQYRNVVQLTSEWNLLDTGINIWRGKSATDQLLIAQERRRRVYQGVVQDTYIAFWRAAVAQSAIPKIDTLLTELEKKLEKNQEQIAKGIVPIGDAQQQKTQILEKKAQLNGFKNALSLAEIELKTLMGYPLTQELTLDLEDKDPLIESPLPIINNSIEEYEFAALTQRPEVREEILNKRISTRDIKLSILETIPGLELLLTYNHDSNKFLAFNNWVDGIAGLTSSINQIITAPTRYKKAENIDLLADKRRQALIAAIITQVHIAAARYDTLSDSYKDQSQSVQHAKSILERAENFNDAGLMAQDELIDTQIDFTIANINRAFAYAEAQDAYGRFINTLGIDLWDENNLDVSIENYAVQIKRNLNISDYINNINTRSVSS